MCSIIYIILLENSFQLLETRLFRLLLSWKCSIKLYTIYYAILREFLEPGISQQNFDGLMGMEEVKDVLIDGQGTQGYDPHLAEVFVWMFLLQSRLDLGQF